MIENKNNTHLGDEGMDLELLNESEKDTSKDFHVEEKKEETSTPIDPKKARRNKIIFFSCLGGTLVLIAGIAIPVSISIINKNTKPAEASVRVYVTTRREEGAPLVKSLLGGTIIDANLGFSYEVDATGLTKPETYSGYTDNSKMVLSAMKHYEDNKAISPITFVKNFFDYSRGCFLAENKDYDLFVNIDSMSKPYADYLANNIKGAASTYGRQNKISFNFDIKKGMLNEGDKLVNSILNNVRVLFYEPKGGMNDYVPNKIEGKRFREDTWMEYLPKDNIEELTAISNKLNNVPKFESEDGYMKLHHSLWAVKELYTNRKKTLETKIKDVDNAVMTNYQNKIDEGDYHTGYAKLPSNKWWKNDYKDVAYDNNWAINFFNGVNLDLDTSDTYENLKQFKTNAVSYMNENQKWFSFALEIATQSQRPYDGDQSESPIDPSDPWYGEEGFDNTPPQGDNWETYWYNQYESQGGKGPRK